MECSAEMKGELIREILFLEKMKKFRHVVIFFRHRSNCAFNWLRWVPGEGLWIWDQGDVWGKQGVPAYGKGSVENLLHRDNELVVAVTIAWKAILRWLGIFCCFQLSSLTAKIIAIILLSGWCWSQSLIIVIIIITVIAIIQGGRDLMQLLGEHKREKSLSPVRWQTWYLPLFFTQPQPHTWQISVQSWKKPYKVVSSEKGFWIISNRLKSYWEQMLTAVQEVS